MARPKKTEVVTENTTIDVTAELMKKLEEMQNQLAELKAENQSLKQTKDSYEDEEEINGDTEIMVISQTVGSLAISTEGNGAGNVYRFEHFGEVQDIPFADLKDIVKNKRRFATEGVYYIANKQAVKKLRLDKDYERIINKDLFTNIFNEKSETIIKAYENAPKLQQEQIVSMIEDRLANKKDVDGNVLLKIGKLCGKDFLRVEEDDE